MKTKLDKPKSRNKSNSPFFNSKTDSGFFGVQPKLKVGQPGDKYEVEADRVADEVVNNRYAVTQSSLYSSKSNAVQIKQKSEIKEKPLAENISPLIQKKKEEEEELQMQPNEKEEEVLQAQTEEEEEEIQAQIEEKRKEVVQTKLMGETMSPVESTLKAGGNHGNKLDLATRAEMEQGFGADFSDVNVHTDSRAIQMNKQLGAQAFTRGKDIYFNEGKYNPDSTDGKHLLAHELTHTIQQTGMVPHNLQMTIGDNHDLNSTRFSGNSILEACFDGERTLQNGSRGTAVSLMQQALVDAGFQLPVYGVDGIFGNETKTALQNFQHASTLATTGILNSETISALDSLYSGGSPVLPPAIPVSPLPTAPPTIVSETIKSAPDSSSDTRTTVGVGERVRITANTAGTWTVSAGHIIGINRGSNMIWEAPPIAASPTITLTTPRGTSVIQFTVVAPNALKMTVARNHAIPVGTAGACMITDVVVNPLNVSFGRTQWLEVPEPATNVSGYFNRFPAATIFHHPNPNYLPFNDNNSGLTDHAAWHAVPAPFSFGTFEWVIPNRYKIDGESDAQGRVFTNTVQAFYMFADGTMMISKGGASVIRLINNTVL